MPMKLFPHQRVAADWLKQRSRAYLADRPRVGKTLALATALAETLAPHETAVVICPAIVRTHWRETLAEAGVNLHSVSIFSYAEITNGGVGLREMVFLGGGGPRGLILDEAHLLKHMTSQRTKLILGAGGYARRTPIVWAASGTPVPRHPGEWYAIGSTLWPRMFAEAGLLTYEAFAERFLIRHHMWPVRHRTEPKVVGLRHADEFRAMLERVTLQRTLADIGMDQPPLLWQVLPLDIPKGEPRPTLGDAAVDADAYASAPEVRHAVGMQKLPLVVDLLIEQLSNTDEKIAVFAHHTAVLGGLFDALSQVGVGCAFVDGSTSDHARDSAVRAFRDFPNVQVFLGQNIACQMGIDLASATTILLVEPDWSAAVNDQIGHRILGPNQKSPHVVAQMISLAETIDDAIVRQNVREAAMHDRLFGNIL